MGFSTRAPVLKIMTLRLYIYKQMPRPEVWAWPDLLFLGLTLSQSSFLPMGTPASYFLHQLIGHGLFIDR